VKKKHEKNKKRKDLFCLMVSEVLANSITVRVEVLEEEAIHLMAGRNQTERETEERDRKSPSKT
jgi:hypothetical protein